MKVKVIKLPTETGIWKTDEFRDLMGFEWFKFPKVGTVLELSENMSSVMYNGMVVCDRGTSMYRNCFCEV